MADIDLRRVHGLGLEGARAAADSMMATLAQRFGLRGQWHENVLKFERPGVTGALAVDERNLHLSVSLGFLLKAMRGSIESAVLRELDTLFAGGPGAAKPTSAPGGSRTSG
jgi:putative polyhydroxyalkanoate system protein